MLSLVLFGTLFTTAQVPEDWSCDAALFADDVCDCGCDADDADCSSTEFVVCVRSGCPAGDAPWEHDNALCMTSTCGDGWKADDEACDDFDGLAGGGCNADCSAVSDGFSCGQAAEGCTAAGEGEGEGDGGEGEGEGAEGQGEGARDRASAGCASTSSAPGAALLGVLCWRRKRARQPATTTALTER